MHRRIRAIVMVMTNKVSTERRRNKEGGRRRTYGRFLVQAPQFTKLGGDGDEGYILDRYLVPKTFSWSVYPSRATSGESQRS